MMSVFYKCFNSINQILNLFSVCRENSSNQKTIIQREEKTPINEKKMEDYNKIRCSIRLINKVKPL